jgi:hypothetical protein
LPPEREQRDPRTAGHPAIYNHVAPAALVADLRQQVKKALAKAFGGYTETATVGGHVARSGELIEEQVYVIETCYAQENDELIVSLAERIRTDLRQETVMIRKDNETFFRMSLPGPAFSGRPHISEARKGEGHEINHPIFRPLQADPSQRN